MPNLSTLAQQQYDLVIGVGFLMAEAMNTVAPKFPKTNFAIIDVDATGLESKPTNAAGVLFKENEAGYLVGYMAGLYIKDEGGGTASSVGGHRPWISLCRMMAPCCSRGLGCCSDSAAPSLQT